MSDKPEVPQDLRERYSILIHRRNQCLKRGALQVREGYWFDHEDQEVCLIERIARAEAELADAEKEVTHLESDLSALRGQLDGKWISVEDRLPEIGEWVWIVIAGVVQHVAYRYHPLGTQWEPDMCDCDWAPAEVVTHWQPLPQPPINAPTGRGDGK